MHTKRTLYCGEGRFKSTTVDQSLRYHDNGTSGEVETALHSALNDPAIMLASLSGEKIVELNDPEDSKHLYTIVKEVLKGNSVRSTALLWDLKSEKLNAEANVQEMQRQHKKFYKKVKNLLNNEENVVIDNERKSQEYNDTDLVKRTTSTRSEDAINDDVAQNDPLLDRAILSIVSHTCCPNSVEVLDTVKRAEEKGAVLGRKRKNTYTMYVIRLKGLEKPFEASWIIHRRFSEFVSLRKSLKAEKHKKLPALPRRRLAGSTTSVVIDERKKGISHFMCELIKDTRIRESKLFLKFVSTDATDIKVD